MFLAFSSVYLQQDMFIDDRDEVLPREVLHFILTLVTKLTIVAVFLTEYGNILID